MDPLRVGIVGAGPRSNHLWTELFLKDGREAQCVLAAVCDTNPASARDWRYKVLDEGGAVTDLEALFARDVDAVMIATPAPTHAPIAVRCLEAGVDVWSEVPMGMSLDELFAILDAQRSNKGQKGTYAYGENYCWFPPVQFAALKHEQDKIGEVFFAEAEYCHSVEHYMIAENFHGAGEVDPERHPETHPTWRATFNPIMYGHTFGPALYVLNRNPARQPEYPVSVAAYGNMKMQRRFATQNFQQCIVHTNRETVAKFTSAFVLPHHGRLLFSFWATRGMFESATSYRDTHFYYEVPPGQAHYPARHECEERYLTDADLAAAGIRTAEGGHGGGDAIMLGEWLAALRGEGQYGITARQAAEMTAIGICAQESIETRRMVDVPSFS